MPTPTYETRQGAAGATFERRFRLDEDNPFDWTTPAAAAKLVVAATADGPPVFIGVQPYLSIALDEGDESVLVVTYVIQPGDTAAFGQFQAWLVVGSADGTWRDGAFLGGFVIEECPQVTIP